VHVTCAAAFLQAAHSITSASLQRLSAESAAQLAAAQAAHQTLQGELAAVQVSQLYCKGVYHSCSVQQVKVGALVFGKHLEGGGSENSWTTLRTNQI
jgi:hypothetical protein